MEYSNTITDKDLIENWVHRWGCSVSEAVLAPEFNYFVHPSIEGFIGYRVKLDTAVVIGDPVCDQRKREELVLAFQDFCNLNHLNIIYLIASESFAKWVVQNSQGSLIEVGDELILNPQVNNKEGPRSSKLRNYISHAAKEGIEIREYVDYDEKVETSINEVASQWLTKRHGPQIYLGPLDFFGNRTSKRWFYAAKDDGVVGAALLSRLEFRNGYLLKHLVTVPSADRGTSEFLVASLLETLGKENCDYVTYGIIPPVQLGEISGLGSATAFMAKFLFKGFKWAFKLDKRKHYWMQFHPTTKPMYVVFTRPKRFFTNIRATLQALNISL